MDFSAVERSVDGLVSLWDGASDNGELGGEADIMARSMEEEGATPSRLFCSLIMRNM